MKKFIAFIICMTIVPALILGGAVGILYHKYFSPQPIEFDFLRGREEIHSIEYVNVSFENGDVQAVGIALVEDIDGFANDLMALECHKGIDRSSFKALYELDTVKGFLINYNDGSIEIFTPYVCLNSDLNIKEVKDILTADVYGFSADEFYRLIEKYGSNEGSIV